MNPFETAKTIYSGKKCELKNTRVVNKIFSFLPQTFFSSQIVNQYLYCLPSWAILGLYNTHIEHKKSMPYVPYVKSLKKREYKIVDKISTHLSCSEAHATQTIAVLKKMGHKPESFFGLKDGE